MLKFRWLVFCFTVLIYAVFGLPTPDDPGLVEGVVGAGLMLSMGIPQAAFSLLIVRVQEPLWMKTGRVFLIYGMTVPVMMAMLQGNHMGRVLRDLFPFLFLLLPFLSYSFFQLLDRFQQNCVLGVILLAGLIFAGRGMISLQEPNLATVNIDALYLVNAPTVLFAALLLSGYAVHSFRLSSLSFLSLMAGCMSFLPLAAMGLAFQRASFGAVGLSLLWGWGQVLRKSLLRALVLIGVGILVFFLISDSLLPLLGALFEKNRLVGSNMRLFELQAVWERVVESSGTVLFGQGWGGTVQSPAVGDLTVNYTHSLISATLLKTGLIGTLLLISYLGTLFLRLPALYRSHPILALALFWPFVIDIFLYASYKSLDFGFILMLLACYGVSVKENNDRQKEQSAENTDHQPGLSPTSGGDGTTAAGIGGLSGR